MFALLAELGDDAVPAVRSLADDPLLVEACAGILAVDGGEQAVAEQLEELPAEDRLSLLENLWRVPHDDVADVLEAMGRALPDKTLAKAARGSAFKARSKR